MSILFEPYQLQFKFDAGTSRGTLKTKSGFLLRQQLGNEFAIGELSQIPGLGVDADVNYEIELFDLLQKLEDGIDISDAFFNQYPSFVFAIEILHRQVVTSKVGCFFNNRFTRKESKIPINGLVWMGTEVFMQNQAQEKLAAGFTTIKFKIGAIDFDKEISLIKAIRKNFTSDQITIRVDANGGFHFSEIKEVLKSLKVLDVHSIEQPIAINQWDNMAELVFENIIPIALDEELVYITNLEDKLRMLQIVKPHYLVLKPSLLGGFTKTDWWIKQSKKLKTDWWITSALESNIGLEAICQFTAEYAPTLPQGLGTGGLYLNNFDTSLKVENGNVFYS